MLVAYVSVFLGGDRMDIYFTLGSPPLLMSSFYFSFSIVNCRQIYSCEEILHLQLSVLRSNVKIMQCFAWSCVVGCSFRFGLFMSNGVTGVFISNLASQEDALFRWGMGRCLDGLDLVVLTSCWSSIVAL